MNKNLLKRVLTMSVCGVLALNFSGFANAGRRRGNARKVRYIVFYDQNSHVRERYELKENGKVVLVSSEALNNNENTSLGNGQQRVILPHLELSSSSNKVDLPLFDFSKYYQAALQENFSLTSPNFRSSLKPINLIPALQDQQQNNEHSSQEKE